jgi:hypothetical protein
MRMSEEGKRSEPLPVPVKVPGLHKLLKKLPLKLTMAEQK